MGSTTATVARKDLHSPFVGVNENCAPISITNSKGAVLEGEGDRAVIKETFHHGGIPSMTESLAAGMTESVNA
ncbi:hypothetical protein B5F44_13770 [Gordonibacter urolithinfaciens]|nr:hypothetical protein B5F44_13770 [Gordonibacter urolithinfaciens]